MALSYVKVRAAQPEIKVYKLADGEGMVLLVHPNDSKYWSLRYRFGGNEKILRWGNTLKSRCHERCHSDPHPTPEIRSRG